MIIDKPKLFEDLTFINIGNETIDIHNDYILIGFEYDDFLTISFSKNDSSKKLHIEFNDFLIVRGNFVFADNEMIMDNFHRGRYEKNDRLHDMYEERACYYMEFLGEGTLEILAKKIRFVLKNTEGETITDQESSVPPQK